PAAFRTDGLALSPLNCGVRPGRRPGTRRIDGNGNGNGDGDGDGDGKSRVSVGWRGGVGLQDTP
ncbi:hypothetical protein I5V39_21555, partial [Stenotrophomonas maltophilia]|nr:hypothetical protein [Stenotrophomonas maltophilia]